MFQAMVIDGYPPDPDSKEYNVYLQRIPHPKGIGGLFCWPDALARYQGKRKLGEYTGL
jgi:hypothetical protein